MLIFGITNISLVAAYTEKPFLGNALTFMMTYVWGRRNEDVKMVFLGILHFNAPYLPWVMLTFSVLIGKKDGIVMDLIGISVGHLYYFLEYVYPVIAEIRGWPIKNIMQPPMFLHWICGSFRDHQEDAELAAAIAAIGAQDRVHQD
jgi:Derlin-2/3